MTDSQLIPFPGRDFDPTNPNHVQAWIDSLPPARVNLRGIGAYLLRVDGKLETFRIERDALEKIAGSAELSTMTIFNRHGDDIDRHCRAMHAGRAHPIKGWVLTAADVPSAH